MSETKNAPDATELTFIARDREGGVFVWIRPKVEMDQILTQLASLHCDVLRVEEGFLPKERYEAVTALDPLKLAEKDARQRVAAIFDSVEVN